MFIDNIAYLSEMFDYNIKYFLYAKMMHDETMNDFNKNNSKPNESMANFAHAMIRKIFCQYYVAGSVLFLVRGSDMTSSIRIH